MKKIKRDLTEVESAILWCLKRHPGFRAVDIIENLRLREVVGDINHAQVHNAIHTLEQEGYLRIEESPGLKGKRIYLL